KGQMLEGGIRVPFLMSWPGTLPVGAVERRPVSALDVVPTALAASSTPIPAGLDGVDLLPFLTGGRTESPHPALFWRMGGQLAIRSDRWKLVRLKTTEPFRLYDLDQDQKESRDLAAAEPQRARDLERRLLEWNGQLASPLW